MATARGCASAKASAGGCNPASCAACGKRFRAQIAAAPTFQFFALYGVAALIYWVICLAMSFVQARLETRLERHVAR